MTAPPEFEPWPKIARLNRHIFVTEKIDGTNSQLFITEDGDLFAGSRTRWLARAPITSASMRGHRRTRPTSCQWARSPRERSSTERTPHATADFDTGWLCGFPDSEAATPPWQRPPADVGRTHPDRLIQLDHSPAPVDTPRSGAEVARGRVSSSD